MPKVSRGCTQDENINQIFALWTAQSFSSYSVEIYLSSVSLKRILGKFFFTEACAKMWRFQLVISKYA